MPPDRPEAWDDGAAAIATPEVGATVRAYQVERIGALRVTLRMEGEIRSRYRTVAERIRGALRTNPNANPTIVIEQAIRTTLAQRVEVVTNGIHAVVARGRTAHEAELAAEYGAAATGVPRTEAFDSVAAQVLRGRISGRSVAVQLADVDAHVASEVSRVVSEARRAGDSALQAARRIQGVAGDALQRDVPRYIEELRASVRHAESTTELRATVDAFARRVLPRQNSVAGTPFTVRGASRRLIARIRSSRGADIDAAVREWVEQRAVRRARTIARTEAARAFNEAYLETVRASPDVEALRYMLSSSHPTPDICDVYASQDVDGLGAGIYRQESPPAIPAHPSCICAFSSVLRRPDGTETLEPHEPRTAADWLASQSSDARRSVLGPTRARIFEESPHAVISPRGEIRTVADARRRAN